MSITLTHVYGWHMSYRDFARRPLCDCRVGCTFSGDPSEDSSVTVRAWNYRQGLNSGSTAEPEYVVGIGYMSQPHADSAPTRISPPGSPVSREVHQFGQDHNLPEDGLRSWIVATLEPPEESDSIESVSIESIYEEPRSPISSSSRSSSSGDLRIWEQECGPTCG